MMCLADYLSQLASLGSSMTPTSTAQAPTGSLDDLLSDSSSSHQPHPAAMPAIPANLQHFPHHVKPHAMQPPAASMAMSGLRIGAHMANQQGQPRVPPPAKPSHNVDDPFKDLLK
eukprot:scaffold2268_cov349-Prasinococcus_capsulatus_cf.AAC.8